MFHNECLCDSKIHMIFIENSKDVRKGGTHII
jgi:hypothetical protein